MTEYLDVLDDEGNVIGKAPQEEIYKKKHNHRIVHILVVHPKTCEVYLQQRIKTKSFLPQLDPCIRWLHQNQEAVFVQA